MLALHGVLENAPWSVTLLNVAEPTRVLDAFFLAHDACVIQ